MSWLKGIRVRVRRRALIAFGGVERYREAHRDVRGMRRIERLGYDLRYALGALVRSPAFTVAVVLTLALGIGANATAFGMLNALLYRAPPQVGEPEGLYRVRVVASNVDLSGARSDRPVSTSYPDYADLRDRTAGLAELSAYWYRNVIAGHGSDAQELRALSVSSNYFSTLRAQPALGRFWAGGDDRDAEAVVVLAYGLWKRSFGGDPDVIGRTMILSELPVTVIGVAPPHFRGIDLDAVDLWIPLGLETRLAAADRLEARNVTWLWMVGRPAPDVALDVIEARATRIAGELAQEPDSYGIFTSARIDLAPVGDQFGGYGRASPIPLWILGVTAVVLLIACANVSSLLLARGAGRRRELAVRAALGASRARIIQLLLIESLLLALIGGAAGLALAAMTSNMLHFLDVPPLDPFIDLRVLVFSFSVALAASLLVGLLPALRSSRADVERELRSAGPRATYDRSRIRAALTVAQIALSIVLLVNAGLFVRSLRNVNPTETSLDPERVAVVTLRFQRGTPSERLWEVKAAAAERVRTLPGVVSAATASGAPFGSGIGVSRYDPTSFGLPPETEVSAVSLDVGPGYFETIASTLRAGRPIDASDRENSPPVVVVSSAMARMFGGEREALGKCMPARSGCAEIVGVVEDSRFFDPSEEPMAAVYRPIAQNQYAGFAARVLLLVRMDVPADALSAVIRDDITALAPDVHFVDVESVASLLRPRLQPWRMVMIVFTLAGGTAFLLAVVGLYGVIAYLVASRTQEMGVRVALGARPLRILGLVLKEGAGMAALGVGLGLLLAPAVSRLLEHRMYGVRPVDPLTYATITLLVVVVALTATLASARRAMRVDPAVALRGE